MPSPHYSQYSLPDFLADDYFVQWVNHPDEESQLFWDSFLRQHPQQSETVYQAIALVKAYRQQEVFTNAQRQPAVWQRIEASLQQQQPARPRLMKLPVFLRVAAAITLITVFGAIAWMTTHRLHTVTTAYEEVKIITLPDQSKVILNGNSSLSYNRHWDGTEPREVWIEGEGFFDVQHLNRDTARITPGDRFLVHSHEVTIEVLGTSFNVKNRRSKTNIGLISGRIRVHQAGQSHQLSEPVVMLPGDYVEYASEKLVEKKKLPKPTQITTWTRHEITFADASLRDISEKLQDEYGYAVEIKDQGLMNARIEGEISVANVQELLSTLATTLDLKIELNNKDIVISRKQ